MKSKRRERAVCLRWENITDLLARHVTRASRRQTRAAWSTFRRRTITSTAPANHSVGARVRRVRWRADARMRGRWEPCSVPHRECDGAQRCASCQL